MSVIPHFNLTEIIRDGWLVTSFIHVPVNYAKPSKPLLEGGGGKGRSTYDTQRT